MPANRFNGFTEYGIGIGLRIPHYQHILEKKPVVDWFEIISENYMIDGGRPLAMLDQILEQYKVVQHGVSMYFGSTAAAQPRASEAAEAAGAAHRDALARAIISAGAAWMARYTHDLLPLPYTWEAVAVAAENIRRVQDFLEVPVALENVSSYAEFHESRDDRVGVSHRGGGARRLRHSARREQYLRQLDQS